MLKGSGKSRGKVPASDHLACYVRAGGDLRSQRCEAISCDSSDTDPSSTRDPSYLQSRQGRSFPIEQGECRSSPRTRIGMPANFLVLNKTCHKILQTYLKDRKFRDSDYLFISQKRNKEGKKVLDPRSVNASIKQFGTHTMRKTFGYLQYAHFKTDINILCERFKHSSPAITRRYIGITEDTVQNCLLNEI